MVAGLTQLLGHGLYTPAEAAFYSRQQTKTVVRWLLGTPNGRPVVQREFADNDGFVSFLDFMQTLAIASIRRQYKVPLQTIRQAVDEARNRHKVDYPFAMDHKTFLFQRAERDAPLPSSEEEAEAKRRYELFIDLGNGSAPVQLTGKNRGNRGFKEVLEPYLKNVSYGEDGLATQFAAYKEGDLTITMDPKRHFGEPITPSGYTAVALWEAVKTEGSIDAAAAAYGVDRTEVELACAYLDYLRIDPPRG